MTKEKAFDIFVWFSLLSILSVVLGSFVPVGISSHFLGVMWLGLVPIAVVCLLVFIVLRDTSADRGIESKSLSFSDLVLVLLPMAPITQYILSNQDILDFIGSLLVGSVFLLVTFMVVCVIPIVAQAGSRLLNP